MVSSLHLYKCWGVTYAVDHRDYSILHFSDQYFKHNIFFLCYKTEIYI